MPFELSLSHIAAQQATVLLDVFVGSNFLRFLLFFPRLANKSFRKNIVTANIFSPNTYSTVEIIHTKPRM